MECRSDPEVLVTVMVYWPMGAPGLPCGSLPPPQATWKSRPANRLHSHFAFLSRLEPRLIPVSAKPNTGSLVA